MQSKYVLSILNKLVSLLTLISKRIYTRVLRGDVLIPTYSPSHLISEQIQARKEIYSLTINMPPKELTATPRGQNQAISSWRQQEWPLLQTQKVCGI